MIGESLHSHIRRLRLERAAGRLKLGRQAVVTIAFEAGYDSHEAFSRAFRSSFGISPTAFRARHEHEPSLRTASAVHFGNGASPRSFRAAPLSEKAMNIQIKTIHPRRVAFMRHVGSYNQVGQTWEKLLVALGKDGHVGPGAEFIGIGHDDPEVTPPDKVRYDACVTVGSGFRPVGDIGVQDVPGGEYAVLTHEGPYEKLNESYHRLLGQWLPRSGRELAAAPCFEVYVNSPENSAPEDLLTDIHAPLASHRSS
jgi:AraC family transcriptional regulator